MVKMSWNSEDLAEDNGSLKGKKWERNNDWCAWYYCSTEH